MQQSEQADPTSLKDGVTSTRIGGYDGFRAGEVARLLYRRNMDRVFACGVVASRLSKLEALEKAIQGKPTSDITESIKKERTRYEWLRGQMNCNLNKWDTSATGTVDRIMRSGMKEYCQYSYYLDYLEANVRWDVTKISETETKIGEGNTSKQATNTEAALNEITSRIAKIDEERTRAHDVLPKAIQSFREMDRTYILHIMLVFIYDDYLKLRDHLGQYMALVGQTFEKAFNAQGDNQE
jgi:hypothetical protein